MPKKTPIAKKRITSTSRKKPTIIHHVASSLVTVSPHSHTGKRAPHRHTSHGFLLLALLFTGVLLFANLGILRAYGLSSSGSATITANIYGAAPTEGAEITFPATNTITDYKYLQVNGTCPDQTLVAIYRNGDFASSTLCDSGSFSVTVQLVPGDNVLQAQDYDGVNQPGPTTPQIVVTYNAPVTPPTPPANGSESTAVATTKTQVKTNPTPTTPAPTAPQPSANPCFNTNTKASSQTNGPIISVGCIYRNIYAGETLALPLSINGGTAPYALSSDWGDSKQDLITLRDNNEHTLEHTYAIAGFHQITLKVTDSNGITGEAQTVVTINSTSTGAPVSPADKVADTAKSLWVNASVPLYIAAVTLALGFWIGEIFQRIMLNRHKFGGGHKPHKL